MAAGSALFTFLGGAVGYQAALLTGSAGAALGVGAIGIVPLEA